MVELLLLAAALSADNFAVSIGYGSSNTRISPGMTALLNLILQCCPGCFRAVWKKISAVRRTGMGNQSGCGLLFSYGNAENFRRTEKTQKKKAGKTRSKTGTSGKTAPPTGIWPAGGFDVGGWNCLRRLCRGSSGDRRTDLFCLLRGRNGGDVCRNCHRKKDGAEKRRKRSTVRRNSVLFTGVFKAHIELHVRKKNQQIPA